ncbi:hypothetical protein KA517_04795 [Candidatus Gracilibacteria bacterium]|nr:hypothetical protein [Candidatus Gracilibacteria bacterium]
MTRNAKKISLPLRKRLRKKISNAHVAAMAMKSEIKNASIAPHSMPLWHTSLTHSSQGESLLITSHQVLQPSSADPNNIQRLSMGRD